MPRSLRDFAKAQGVRLSAVQRAIKTGRLTPASAGKDARGRWTILDETKAAEEWAAHTRPRVDASKPVNGGSAPSRLADATRREREARAQVLELEIARKTRALVPAREVELRWAGIVVAARTKLLGLPSRAKGRLPHLSAADLVVLEALIREALEDLVAETPSQDKALS